MDKILTYVIVVLITIIATVMDLAIGTQIKLKQLFSNFWFYLLFIIQSAMASLVFYGLSATEKFNDNSILDAIIVGFLFPMLLRSQFTKSEKFSGLIDIYERVLTFTKDRIDEPAVKYRMKLAQIIMSHCVLAHLREVVFNHIEVRNLTDEQKEFERRNIENRLQEVEEQHQAANEIEKQKKMIFIRHVSFFPKNYFTLFVLNEVKDHGANPNNSSQSSVFTSIPANFSGVNPCRFPRSNRCVFQLCLRSKPVLTTVARKRFLFHSPCLPVRAARRQAPPQKGSKPTIHCLHLSAFSTGRPNWTPLLLSQRAIG